MAGIKNSFSKGLTTINVKASNFMEENKLKTHIATLESEIEKLKLTIGEKAYQGYKDGMFTLESVSAELELMQEKYNTIIKINEQIEELSAKEVEILGGVVNQNAVNQHAEQEGGQFCSMCGAPYKAGYKFCEKCGNKLV